LQSDKSFLKRLLQYELRCAERYRRFVSLVMVGSADTVEVNLNQLLEGTVRSSDEMTIWDSAAAILMAETDAEGAMAAIDRFKRKYEPAVDLRFGVVTFPDDGGGADSLLSIASRRYSEASMRSAGAVVRHD
jgi:hypothetical protein